METFEPVTLITSDWTLIADGAAYSEVGLQLNSPTDVAAVIVAAGAPAAGATASLIMRNGGDKSVSLTLTVTDKVYAKSLMSGTMIRGYRVAV